MHVLDTYVGSRAEGIEERLDGGHETVRVGEAERRRSRFRTTTTDGTEIGVVVGRELRAGDVLAGDGLTVVVELEQVDALAVDLTDASGSLAAAVELGHAMGNRHWDIAVRDGTVYVPVADSVDRMCETVEPAMPAGAEIATTTVPPSLFDERSDHPGHGHSHDDGQEHSHESDPGHSEKRERDSGREAGGENT
jgi:urease accessory protein